MLARTHAILTAARRPTVDAFDAHVLACLLASALVEIEHGETTITEATGLDVATLVALVGTWFPGAPLVAFHFDTAGAPVVEMEEDLLRELLENHRDHRTGEAGRVLPAMIARRAMRPDHLWQDLGLRDRGELNRLLARHFPTLHAGNTANMRWKKYFYRKLCEAEGFALCTAPSCAVCADFTSCFGSEDGESRLAVTRRAVDTGAGLGSMVF